ncbi:hypothetical protein EV1_039823 [Malus domestica]
MEKSKGSKFIKFSSKIDKQLANTDGVQAKATKENKENFKGYLEDYSSNSLDVSRLIGNHTFSSLDVLSNGILRRFTLGCPSLGTNFSNYFTDRRLKSKNE